MGWNRMRGWSWLRAMIHRSGPLTRECGDTVPQARGACVSHIGPRMIGTPSGVEVVLRGRPEVGRNRGLPLRRPRQEDASRLLQSPVDRFGKARQ
jgi:hypothetical protein